MPSEKYVFGVRGKPEKADFAAADHFRYPKRNPSEGRSPRKNT